MRETRKRKEDMGPIYHIYPISERISEGDKRVRSEGDTRVRRGMREKREEEEAFHGPFHGNNAEWDWVERVRTKA